MPERSLPIAAYAAGASVAAATLVYIFGPTLVLGQENGPRKRNAVGLRNYANDCFINSVLQALAGLPTLQTYLLQETQRREADGIEIYGIPVRKTASSKSATLKDRPDWQLISLQRGDITTALRFMLDELNERPASKKIISAQGFVLAIEQAFRTRVSRHQQDAQEFLQIVLQRIAEESHAAVAVRENSQPLQRTRRSTADASAERDGRESDSPDATEVTEKTVLNTQVEGDESRNDHALIGLPFEGKISSQIECAECAFKPKPSISTFVTLSLIVPQETTSTSLDSCFDGMLKVETIDGFKCDRCRLTYAYRNNIKLLQQSRLSTTERQRIESDQLLLDHAIQHDPEEPSPKLNLKDMITPLQRITKHMSLSKYPMILSIHLSRSLWTGYSSSAKNLAKVSFPEVLPLGNLVERHRYQLISVVTHKGGHNSGHYETFRRQALPPSTPTNDVEVDSSQPTLDEGKQNKEQVTSDKKKKSIDLRRSGRHSIDVNEEQSKKKKVQDRWWRISDDKVKECKTQDVLAMQKEIYLLFYELVEH